MDKKNRSFFYNSGIRCTIFTYFTVTALTASLLITFSICQRLSNQVFRTVMEESQSLIDQVARSVENYLRTVMKLSDSLYYGAVKNADLSSESISSEIALLYGNNKDNVSNIAFFSQDGASKEAVPAARIKTNLDVTGDSWFTNTLGRMENQRLSNPHVQYILDDNESQYHWVISLSRAVGLTGGTPTDQDVLLVNLSYSSLAHLFDGVTTGTGGYVYLVSSDGEILYHPEVQLIDSGRVAENNLAAAGYKDGNHLKKFGGREHIIIVKSIGYTGRKVMGVTPKNVVSLNTIRARLFIVFIVTLVLFILTLISSYTSSRITNPTKELEKSMGTLETGNLDAPVYIGGSHEIQHLRASISSMAKQIRVLISDIATKHGAKGKQKFDTLQSQTNPHLPYNTLDIIVWMIENEQKAEAVKVVTALTRLFRISLSKGESIITVRDELGHVRNYLMIQHMRFRSRFSYTIDASKECLKLASLELMLQPLVESAIYHGMGFMDGDGEIVLAVWEEADGLCFTVRDSGLDMTTEQVENLFSDFIHVTSKRGSRIGVKNVNERIELYFGEEYGLIIHSEPNEGTGITIHLSAVPYSQILAEGEGA